MDDLKTLATQSAMDTSSDSSHLTQPPKLSGSNPNPVPSTPTPNANTTTVYPHETNQFYKRRLHPLLEHKDNEFWTRECHLRCRFCSGDCGVPFPLPTDFRTDGTYGTLRLPFCSLSCVKTKILKDGGAFANQRLNWFTELAGDVYNYHEDIPIVNPDIFKHCGGTVDHAEWLRSGTPRPPIQLLRTIPFVDMPMVLEDEFRDEQLPDGVVLATTSKTVTAAPAAAAGTTPVADSKSVALDLGSMMPVSSPLETKTTKSKTKSPKTKTKTKGKTKDKPKTNKAQTKTKNKDQKKTTSGLDKKRKSTASGKGDAPAAKAVKTTKVQDAPTARKMQSDAAAAAEPATGYLMKQAPEVLKGSNEHMQSLLALMKRGTTVVPPR